MGNSGIGGMVPYGTGLLDGVELDGVVLDVVGLDGAVPVVLDGAVPLLVGPVVSHGGRDGVGQDGAGRGNSFL